MLLFVEIVDSNGQKESVEVSLSKKEFAQNELCLYKLDDTIEVKGDLLIRKREDKIYLNLYASQIKPTTEIPQHGIRGDMMFRGKVGKNIEEKTGKKVDIISGNNIDPVVYETIKRDEICIYE